MKISGAIFDMDGTLLDSMFVWDKIGERYLISQGITPPADIWDTIKEMSLKQVSVFMAKEYGINKPTNVIIDEINALVEPFYRSEVLPKEGIIQLLESFSKRGIKMCVATATDIHLVEMALKRNSMYHYFDSILTCNLVGAGKDEPVIFQKACEILGTPQEETPVFEDSLYAAKTAKAAGFPVICISDKHSAGDQAELKALGDGYFVDFTSIPKDFFC